MSCPPLASFCIRVLAPNDVGSHQQRIEPSGALLNAFKADPLDASTWATLVQVLVHPLPPHLHDHFIPFAHPNLILLQKIRDSPDFSLVTLVSFPHCIHLHDDDIARLRTLHRLIALDLRGCAISSYALTVLARGLATSPDHVRTGTWGLRLLSLHGCPNIDNNVLPVLVKFPLLSVVDLRFTRCTPTAVNAYLSSIDFSPSGINSLFYPAPLSLALCTLEKVARSTSDLYSCPPQSVFRVHVDELGHMPSHSNKLVPVNSSSASQLTIQTISSPQDTVVFIPPLQKSAKNRSFLPPNPSLSITPTSPPINRPVDLVSNVSSFYENAPARNRSSILPLSAQAVHSSEHVKLNPLAIARSPPSWKILDTLSSHNSHITVACHHRQSVENPNEKKWTGQALDAPLKVDHARLRKRGSDTVADMVHQLARKRLKVQSEFTLAKTRAPSVKSRNPFVGRNHRSVFAESSTKTSDKPMYETSKQANPSMELPVCRSLPTKIEGQLGTLDVKRPSKPLIPITMLKPPILPKELLPPPSRPASKLRQTRLSFGREGEGA